MFEKHRTSLELIAKGKSAVVFFPTRSFVSFSAMVKEKPPGKAFAQAAKAQTFSLMKKFAKNH
jgi:hypothetical protein